MEKGVYYPEQFPTAMAILRDQNLHSFHYGIDWILPCNETEYKEI